MAKTYVLLDHVLEKQKGAVDPEANVWVHANAGSGKTHVLSERVIRLLLDNVDPARILCLTYTKAAASVMKSRIFERLGRSEPLWAWALVRISVALSRAARQRPTPSGEEFCLDASRNARRMKRVRGAGRSADASHL